MEIYLTPELKAYYMDDFNNNVLTSTHSSWQLDEEIRNILVDINHNPNIQTLYSKKHKNSFTDHDSYIHFAYSSTVELQLFRYVISEMTQIFSDNLESINYAFNPPDDNINHIMSKDYSIGMGCADDPKFFRINSIRILLESYDMKRHDRFWEEINSRLSTIKPK